MNKTLTSAMTGVALTAAVGTAAYLASGRSSASRRKKFQKNAGKAVKAVGAVVDNLSSMMR